jgi:hypothetical protein
LSRIDPAYFEAVAQEQRNRLFAYLDDAEPLCGCPVVPLTWRIFFELHLAGSAYLAGREPTRDDFFLLLWRLHPWFRRPDGSLPNLRSGRRRPPRWLVWLAQVSLYRRALVAPVNGTEAAIRQRIKASFQDAPSVDDVDAEEIAPAKLSQSLSLFDSVQAYFVHHCGYTRDQIMDLPIAWSFQVLRAQAIMQDPKEAAQRFIPPSAEKLKFVS